MQIGDLARRTNVTVQTIRYYERVGVLPSARRAQNGRRDFNQEDVERLTFVRRARGLGFGLPAVRALLTLKQRPEAPCREASRLAAEQLASVESRLAELTALRDQLKPLVSGCNNKRAGDCRVIEALRDETPLV